MHNARPFMPPFPGSEREKSALAAYLTHLQFHREALEGAQSAGVTALPKPRRGSTATADSREP
jgi:hypothetical protein